MHHSTTGPPTPITPHATPKTGQMRTEWRYILKRSYLSLLSRFSVFLFYNPETAVHQPPASAPRCPREQLRREVISQSDEWRPGRQAGRQAPRTEQGCSNHQEGEGNPAGCGPPSHQRKCLSVLFSRVFSLLGRALLCHLSVLVSPRFSTLQSRDKTVPRHAIQFT